MNVNENQPPNTAVSPGLDDPRVVEVLDQYLQALEGGQKPDRQALLARHPEIAGPLAEWPSSTGRRRTSNSTSTSCFRQSAKLPTTGA